MCEGKLEFFLVSSPFPAPALKTNLNMSCSEIIVDVLSRKFQKAQCSPTIIKGWKQG